MAFPGWAGAAFALALTHPIPASGGDNSGAIHEHAEGNWTAGESWTDPAPRPGDWSPWPTDDPAIWAADACLGFYLTRDRAVFAPAEIDEKMYPDWGPQLIIPRADPAARVHVFDYPGGPYGVFQCRTASWPHIGAPDPAALTAWAESRLSEPEGWQQVTDARGLPRPGINRHNSALGVSVRVEWLPWESMLIEVQADYHGPPIVFDGPGPY